MVQSFFAKLIDLLLTVSDKTLRLGDPEVKSQSLATTSVNLSTGLFEKLHKFSEWKGMLNALGTLINRVSSKSSLTERKRKARNLIIRYARWPMDTSSTSGSQKASGHSQLLSPHREVGQFEDKTSRNNNDIGYCPSELLQHKEVVPNSQCNVGYNQLGIYHNQDNVPNNQYCVGYNQGLYQNQESDRSNQYSARCDLSGLY